MKNICASIGDYYSDKPPVTPPATPACKAGDPIYTYDILNRVTSMISPAGVTTYEYDSSSGRLSKIITPEGKEFKYHYDKGQLKEIELPNGITSSYTFDANGNLIDLQYRKEDGPPSPGGFGGLTQRFQYTYDKNGMRTSMTDNDGTHDYTYDALYQITRATHPSLQNPVAELAEAEQFQYDELGNWLNDNRVHNELNQLIEDDSCFYHYDLDGNMTRKISKSTNDTTEFEWDIENKLVEVKKPGLLVQYDYDALGRRATKKVNSNVTQFRYDGEDLILEMNDSDSVIANYTFGPGIDNPLAMHRNNKNYYYLKDGLGSVTELTDSTGNAVKEYRYSVFGKIVQENGDTALWNPFTYTGREWEKELGIYFYRARYFDPDMGRFLSEDPWGITGGINLYQYVKNSPKKLRDPYGLKPGDSYPTQDAAGSAAIRDVNQTSADQSREKGGWVYRKPDGSYSYTAPATGDKDGITLPPPPPTTTADYHTHGSDDPGYDNNNFSPTDIQGNLNMGIEGYLGTPEGSIKKNDNKNGGVSTIDFVPMYNRSPADACNVR